MNKVNIISITFYQRGGNEVAKCEKILTWEYLELFQYTKCFSSPLDTFPHFFIKYITVNVFVHPLATC